MYYKNSLQAFVSFIKVNSKRFISRNFYSYTFVSKKTLPDYLKENSEMEFIDQLINNWNWFPAQNRYNVTNACFSFYKKTLNYPLTRNCDEIVTFDVFSVIVVLLRRMISHQYAKLPKGKWYQNIPNWTRRIIIIIEATIGSETNI